MSTTLSGNNKPAPLTNSENMIDSIPFTSFLNLVSMGMPYNGKIDSLLYVKFYKPTHIELKPPKPKEGFRSNVLSDPDFVHNTTLDLYGITIEALKQYVETKPTTATNPIGFIPKSRYTMQTPTTSEWLKVGGKVLNFYSAGCIVDDVVKTYKGIQDTHLRNIFGINVNTGTDIVFFALAFVPYGGILITAVYVVAKVYVKVEYNKDVGEFVQEDVIKGGIRKTENWLESFERWIIHTGTGFGY